MSRALRLVVGMAVLGALVLGSVSSTIAGGPKILDAPMIGIPTGGLVLNGVIGGGVPWAIDEGRAKLFADGRLQLEVNGLVVASSGVNPIQTGRAVVTCGDAIAARSPVVPFSATGDARVDATLDLPAGCLAPSVFFVGIIGPNERWFAVNGV